MSNTTPGKQDGTSTSSKEAQQTIESHKTAATHHTEAAKHHTDAAKHHEIGDPAKAAESTNKAKEHASLAGNSQKEIETQNAKNTKM